MPAQRSAALSVVCLVGVLLVPIGASAQAGGTPNGSLTAYMHPVKVVTSTGRHLRLWLQAESGSLDVTLDRGRLPRAEEIHDWAFTPQRRVFRFDRATGRGHIDARPTSTGHFAQIHLDFRRAGAWSSEPCSNGSASDAPIRAVGTIAFRTHTDGRRPWGRVATFTQPLHVSVKGRLRASDNCAPVVR